MKTNNDSDIGKLIKQKRKEKGLTLEKVAKSVGVGKSTVSKWERGAILNMKKDKIDALSLVLGIDPLVFIFGVDIQETQKEQITPREFQYEVKELLTKTDISEQEKALIEQTLNVICSEKE